MPYSVRSLLSLVAMIFMVFGSNVSQAEDTRPIHIIIAADQSHSMYEPGFRSIELQVAGLTNALTAYSLACGDITISYFSWGGVAGHVYTTPLMDETSQRNLADFIRREALIDRGATNHPIAWQTVLGLYNPSFATVVVFLTNGSGYLGVFTPHEDIKVIKVGVVFESAQTYLTHNFLPGVGELKEVHNAEALTTIILETLKGLDQPCLG